MTDAQWHGVGHLASLVSHLIKEAVIVWLALRLYQARRELRGTRR